MRRPKFSLPVSLPFQSSNRVLELRKALDSGRVPEAALVEQLIEELMRGGDRAGAIEAYWRFATLHPQLAQASARLRQAYERALWSVPDELPTNLPVARSALVGRHSETVEIASSLGVHGFIALIGPAGVGKTRLALEAGRRMLPEFPDGVWWCDLTNVTSPEQLYAVVGGAIKLESRQPDLQDLLAALASRATLLILDRCESVMAPVERLTAHLRSACAGVRVLITCRTPIEGADPIRVHCLPVPREGKIGRLEALASDAVRLFVERAVAADRSFAITDENALSVARICRGVEGSPFGIELAAAYLAHASLDEVARRITHHALQDVSSAAYASVDWAYHLLAPADAALLLAVSIFPRYWTIDGASAVFGSDASRGVERLTAMSLVIAERSESGLTRYSLLDATRQYAYERLASSELLEKVRARLLERMTSVVRALRAVNGDAPKARPDAMQLAVNLCHALQIGIESPDCLELALQLCGLLGAEAGGLMVLPSAFGIVKDLLQHAKRAGLAETALYADALSTYAWLANYTGDHALANDLHAEAIASARRSDDGSRLARALSGALPPLLNSRRYSDAHTLALEALECGRAVDDVAACAEALRGLSAVEYYNGRYEEAIRYYELFEQLPQDHIPLARIGLMLTGFSAIMARKGDYARARAAIERALGIAYERQDLGAAAHCEKNLAFFLLAQGHLLIGHEALRRSVSLAQMSANRLTQLDALEELAAASIREDQLAIIAYVLGYVDAERKRVCFHTVGMQAERAQRIRDVVRRLCGAQPYEVACARGELAKHGEIFAAVSRLEPGDGTLEQVDRFGDLSPREREVAELAMQGLTNRAIAESLNVSVRTVDAHMATIFRKLDIERRDQL